MTLVHNSVKIYIHAYHAKIEMNKIRIVYQEKHSLLLSLINPSYTYGKYMKRKVIY